MYKCTVRNVIRYRTVQVMQEGTTEILVLKRRGLHFFQILSTTVSYSCTIRQNYAIVVQLYRRTNIHGALIFLKGRGEVCKGKRIWEKRRKEKEWNGKEGLC